MQTSLTVHSRQQRRERTHARIKSSLLQLMSEKSFEDITVTELAQEAGINRKTFYSHFEGMDAVLAEVEDDFVGQILRPVAHRTARPESTDPEGFFPDAGQ